MSPFFGIVLAHDLCGKRLFGTMTFGYLPIYEQMESVLSQFCLEFSLRFRYRQDISPLVFQKFGENGFGLTDFGTPAGPFPTARKL
jgi:hypothetical protein